MSALPDVWLTQLEESRCCDKKRGEGGSCLCHGSDVLMCDPEANEQLLHYPLSAEAGLQQRVEIKACGCHEGEKRTRINRCSHLHM